MIIDVKGKDAYTEVLNAILEITEDEMADFLVKIRTETCGTSTELLTCDSNGYYWESDWYEGGDTVELLGIISVYTVDVPDLDKGPYKDNLRRDEDD